MSEMTTMIDNIDPVYQSVFKEWLSHMTDRDLYYLSKKYEAITLVKVIRNYYIHRKELSQVKRNTLAFIIFTNNKKIYIR